MYRLEFPRGRHSECIISSFCWALRWSEIDERYKYDMIPYRIYRKTPKSYQIKKNQVEIVSMRDDLVSKTSLDSKFEINSFTNTNLILQIVYWINALIYLCLFQLSRLRCSRSIANNTEPA